VKAATHNAYHADQEFETSRLHLRTEGTTAHQPFPEVTTMFNTRQLIQSAFVAATVAATAPVHADADFATGGYARFAPAQSVQGSPVPATPEFSFATGGFSRIVREVDGASIAEPTPTVGTRQPSFATGGYAREVVSEATVLDDALRVAGYPWDNGGYKSDGGFTPTPADAVIVASNPWDNGGYKSDGWRAPDLQG
jgi:hypothetical protein